MIKQRSAEHNIQTMNVPGPLRVNVPSYELGYTIKCKEMFKYSWKSEKL